MRAIILAAGKGTRMRSSSPKVLHEILGKSLVQYPLDHLKSLKIKDTCIVIGHGADLVRSKLGKTYAYAIQKEQKGTGHAVLSALSFIKKKSSGDILIMPGDMPLLTRETLRKFMNAHKKNKNDMSVLSSKIENPKGYGRIIREGSQVIGIREELDASSEERKINEVNTGVYIFKSQVLVSLLKKLGNRNKKKEYYLTDAIALAQGKGLKVKAFSYASETEGLGVNSQKELSVGVRVIRDRENEKHLKAGVVIVDPDQTYIEPGVQIGAGTKVFPWTYIESNVKISNDCEIGPCAKIRSGSTISKNCVVGSFVEINRSTLGNNVTAKHLAYLGDAIVAEGSNIGAGSVTANFDGKKKHQTRLGKNVLVGANTTFVAPVNIPNNVKTGASSVVTKKVKVKSGETLIGVPAKSLKKNKNRK